MNKLIGNHREFSMESRLFHYVCCIAIVSLASTSVFDYLIDLPILSVAMFLILGLVAFTFYTSRVKKNLYTGIILFSFFNNILLSINFYYNSGLNGPTLLIFMLSFFLVIAIAPKKQYWIWIPLHIITVVTLIVFAYYNPEKIADTYSDRVSRYIDFAFSYVEIIAVIFVGITFIRKSYNMEKVLAEERTKELAANNETKDKLFSIIAHDLRAPLNSLQNYLEMYNELGASEEEKNKMEKALLLSTKNTSEMLSNLLYWTRTQMDGISANLVTLSVAEVLKNTFEVQSVLAKEKGIDLHYNIDPIICATADADMLQLVIRNLINNAIKFTRPGGQITVKAQCSKNECCISIRDTGIGIPTENQGELFSLKSKSTYGTGKEKGVGLGLVMCKNYIELQKGKIWFKSIPDSGTTFFISLPSPVTFAAKTSYAAPATP